MSQDAAGDFAKALAEFSHDQLSLVQHYSALCSERAKEAEKSASKKLVTPHQRLLHLRESALYSSEQDTWLLVFRLYQDRLLRNGSTVPDVPNPSKCRTEKQVWEYLCQSQEALRELQILVEWLEATAATTLETMPCVMEEAKWKRTSELLQEGLDAPELDPDGPSRTTRHLEEDDQEDEERLQRMVWLYVRAGKLAEAQKLCRDSGQHWRAASLSGEMPWHDWGLVLSSEQPLGNSTRPLWFEAASALAAQEGLNPYERATFGILSGNLQHVLPVCLRWEDHLWARAKTALIHARCRAVTEAGLFADMTKQGLYKFPEPPSLHSIFEDLLRSDAPEVRQGSNQPYHIIQTLVALDRPALLLSLLTHWTLSSGSATATPPQLLRFGAHMGLFLHSIKPEWQGKRDEGEPEDLTSADSIIVSYIRHLITSRQYSLVALYVSKLQQERQVGTYAAFLKDISNREERQRCLELAQRHCLDVHLITQCVVRLSTSIDRSKAVENPKDGAVTQEDRSRIAALEWLMFDPNQRAHALRHSNTLTRQFILNKKLTAAREVQAALPSDTIALVKRPWSYRARKPWEANAVREHLSLNAYLSALKAYEGWLTAFHKQPTPPPPLQPNSLPSKEIAWVQQQGEYQLAYGQWKEEAVKRAEEALHSLFAVLTFPLGWLKDELIGRAQPSNALIREQETKELRGVCIPQAFVLCHTVLHETQQYQACMELANLVADEGQALYKDFSVDELRSFLAMLRKSALASLL